jgi:hypothetical protein
VRRARAKRSITPPLRNDHSSIHAAVTPRIVAAIGVRSRNPLMLLSTAANPVMAGTNVVPRPVACAENSCHQS